MLKVPMLACPLRLELHRNAIGLGPSSLAHHHWITIGLSSLAMFFIQWDSNGLSSFSLLPTGYD